MVKKYVQRWKNKVAIKKAINEFSGSGSRVMRTLTGNYPGTIRNIPWAKPGSRTRTQIMRNHLMSLTKWLRSKAINTPTLYKGLSKNNAKQFIKTGKFTTRTPTSTSLNRFQAETFTNNKPKVLLVIPPGKRNAMILGQHGVRARQPREQEVILAPGTFKKIGVNKKTGNYLVNYVNAGRSVPRRKNFII
jgi:hypothetical protein